MIFALSAAFYLYLQSGIDVLYLTLIGGFFVLFYTWPLKHFALGEVAVFLCWGPLMILGSYTVISGQSAFLGADNDVFLLSIVYGLAPTLVIMGKHMDKYDIDKSKGVKSLPVVIGIKASAYICVFIIAVQWILLGYLALETWLLCVCLPSLYYLPKLISKLRKQKPENKPESYPAEIWPLWYSAFTFQYVRVFSVLLIVALGLALFFR